MFVISIYDFLLAYSLADKNEGVLMRVPLWSYGNFPFFSPCPKDRTVLADYKKSYCRRHYFSSSFSEETGENLLAGIRKLQIEVVLNSIKIK